MSYYNDDDDKLFVFAKKTVEVCIEIHMDDIVGDICTRGKSKKTIVSEVTAAAIAAAEKGLGKEMSRTGCIKEMHASATYRSDTPQVNNAESVAWYLMNRGNEQWRKEEA